jgi:D-3-phosphoglycerate dehydrogenase
MRVLYNAPRRKWELEATLHAEYRDMYDLLRESDFVSVHVPLTPETRHLVGRDELALMRPTAYLVNVSRGGVVDQAALVAALDAGRLAGAALDVLEDEPPAPDDPLLARSDVLLTPHAAHYSIDSLDELRQTAVEDVARVLAGEAPRHPVNRPRQAVGP